MVTRAPLNSRKSCTRVYRVTFLRTAVALVSTITASHVNVHTTELKLIKLYRELCACASATDSRFKFLANCGELPCDFTNTHPPLLCIYYTGFPILLLGVLTFLTQRS